MTRQTTTFHLQEDVSRRLANHSHTKACIGSSDIIPQQRIPVFIERSADIKSCHPNAELQQLAEHIDTSLLQLLLGLGGQSKPVAHLPQFGTEDSIENLSEIDYFAVREQHCPLVDGPRRDNNRCVFTKVHEKSTS